MKGRPAFERAIAVIRDEVKDLGITVDTAALEGNALIEQILSAKYDAVYFNFSLSDTDPSINADFWPSTGGEHFWDREQKTPATPWEAMLDDLFRRMTASTVPADRKRMFDEMQRIFIEHQPMIYFAAPRVFVASSTRVGNVTPTVVPPRLLWSPDTITVSSR
jgi:ABC-type transport system substrate-binding protein